jgi:hypothetical protein
MHESMAEPFRESLTISFMFSELAPLEEILSIFESLRSMSVRCFRTLSILIAFDEKMGCNICPKDYRRINKMLFGTQCAGISAT